MAKYFWAGLLAIVPAAVGVGLISHGGMKGIEDAASGAAPKAPELQGGALDWINTPNSKPLHLYGAGGVLTSDPLAPGKHTVALVDFWEYTCINCIRTFPYVKEWASRYKNDGLVVVGIHSPEFQFAHDRANVAAAVKRFGITYPIVVDSDYANWNAFGNESWPMEYLIDSRGHIVDSHAGEGEYVETEQQIRRLLLAANPGEKLPPAFGEQGAPVTLNRSFDSMTGEIYGGAQRGHIQNSEGFNSGQVTNYAPIQPSQWVDGQMVLSGLWNFQDEYVQHARVNASDMVGVRYHACDAVAVIKPQSRVPFKVVVTQDGKPVVKADAGADIHYDADGFSYLLIDAPREYQITHNHAFGEHVLSLTPGTDKFRLYELDFTANQLPPRPMNAGTRENG